mmetsp:Transcript_5381/g.13009  ORF Transcript_5381/g.13009 Transcript_5381/m.13009 type:complete len:287 (+) Transcript_5381:456-1316(+)
MRAIVWVRCEEHLFDIDVVDLEQDPITPQALLVGRSFWVDTDQSSTVAFGGELSEAKARKLLCWRLELERVDLPLRRIWHVGDLGPSHLWWHDFQGAHKSLEWLGSRILGHAKINQLHFAVHSWRSASDENVLRLEVAMHQALAVHVLQSRQDFSDDVQGDGLAHWAGLDDVLCELLAVDNLHHQHLELAMVGRARPVDVCSSDTASDVLVRPNTLQQGNLLVDDLHLVSTCLIQDEMLHGHCLHRDLLVSLRVPSFQDLSLCTDSKNLVIIVGKLIALIGSELRH